MAGSLARALHRRTGLSNETKSKTQEQIGVLAGKTSECPECEGYDDPVFIPGITDDVIHESELVFEGCKRCKGTGHVETFPSLRKLCLGLGPIEVIEALTMSKCKGDRCKFCHGKEWVPVMVGDVDLNALIHDAGESGLGLRIQTDPEGPSDSEAFRANPHDGNAMERVAYIEDADTPTMAVIAALAEAVTE